GSALRGFGRSRGKHDMQVQTPDGRFHLLSDTEYRSVSPEKGSTMPILKATPAERRDLLAYLSSLGGVTAGPLSEEWDPIPPAAIDNILHPKPGDWPTYNGDLRGNRYSALDQINVKNASRLQLQWSYSIPYSPLEMTPLVVDGVMYVTGPNRVCA